jgi:5-methylcytosine-specific restriction endonuclease McrA
MHESATLPPVSDGEDNEMPEEKIPHGSWQKKLIAEARQRQSEREKGYRAKALKIHPPICARCGREFGGKKLHDLTVHHKDHNHENNPADGSNWELLCLYCHENEHSRQAVADAYDNSSLADPVNEEAASSGFRPFADLETLLRKK